MPAVPNKQVGTTEEALQDLWLSRLYLCRCGQCIELCTRAMGEGWTAKALKEVRDSILPKVRKKST